MKDFFGLVHSLLEHNIGLEQRQSVFDEFKILDNECMYVIDFNQNKLLYKKGFENVLGYKNHDMDLGRLFETYHPEDEEIISKVVREFILHTIKDPSHGKDNSLFLKYRRQRKDGSYITVLSQSSIYDLDSEGNRLKTITRLTDVSFANDFKSVSYSFKARGLDNEAFGRMIHKEAFELFTNRELEIIKEMVKKSTNREISESLFISRHTVATHRKNIFRKTECHNVDELIEFCEAKGMTWNKI